MYLFSWNTEVSVACLLPIALHLSLQTHIQKDFSLLIKTYKYFQGNKAAGKTKQNKIVLGNIGNMNQPILTLYFIQEPEFLRDKFT